MHLASFPELPFVLPSSGALIDKLQCVIWIWTFPTSNLCPLDVILWLFIYMMEIKVGEAWPGTRLLCLPHKQTCCHNNRICTWLQGCLSENTWRQEHSLRTVYSTFLWQVLYIEYKSHSNRQSVLEIFITIATSQAKCISTKGVHIRHWLFFMQPIITIGFWCTSLFTT